MPSRQSRTRQKRHGFRISDRNRLRRKAIENSAVAACSRALRPPDETPVDRSPEDILFSIYDRDWTSRDQFLDGIRRYNEVLSREDFSSSDRVFAAALISELLSYVVGSNTNIYQFVPETSGVDGFAMKAFYDLLEGALDFLRSNAEDSIVSTWEGHLKWFEERASASAI